MTIEQLRSFIYNKALSSRKLRDLIFRDTFDSIYNALSVEIRKKIVEAVSNNDFDSVLEFIGTYTRKELAEKSMRELRKIASTRLVRYYAKLTREELIMNICEGVTND